MKKIVFFSKAFQFGSRDTISINFWLGIILASSWVITGVSSSSGIESKYGKNFNFQYQLCKPNVPNDKLYSIFQKMLLGNHTDYGNAKGAQRRINDCERKVSKAQALEQKMKADIREDLIAKKNASSPSCIKKYGFEPEASVGGLDNFSSEEDEIYGCKLCLDEKIRQYIRSQNAPKCDSVFKLLNFLKKGQEYLQKSWNFTNDHLDEKRGLLSGAIIFIRKAQAELPNVNREFDQLMAKICSHINQDKLDAVAKSFFKLKERKLTNKIKDLYSSVVAEVLFVDWKRFKQNCRWFHNLRFRYENLKSTDEYNRKKILSAVEVAQEEVERSSRVLFGTILFADEVMRSAFAEKLKRIVNKVPKSVVDLELEGIAKGFESLNKIEQDNQKRHLVVDLKSSSSIDSFLRDSKTEIEVLEKSEGEKKRGQVSESKVSFNSRKNSLETDSQVLEAPIEAFASTARSDVTFNRVSDLDDRVISSDINQIDTFVSTRDDLNHSLKESRDLSTQASSLKHHEKKQSFYRSGSSSSSSFDSELSSQGTHRRKHPLYRESLLAPRLPGQTLGTLPVFESGIRSKTLVSLATKRAHMAPNKNSKSASEDVSDGSS